MNFRQPADSGVFVSELCRREWFKYTQSYYSLVGREREMLPLLSDRRSGETRC
jgi:hypothetical protein